MSESSFWNYLRKLLPKEGHYTRVENHDTGAGFPDVNYTLNVPALSTPSKARAVYGAVRLLGYGMS
jgi:hypothetical protein